MAAAVPGLSLLAEAGPCGEAGRHLASAAQQRCGSRRLSLAAGGRWGAGGKPGSQDRGRGRYLLCRCQLSEPHASASSLSADDGRRETSSRLHAVTSSPVTSISSKTSPLLTRRLILLRHAKSSWADTTLKDHERPLSKRGTIAAGNVARKLKELGWLPTVILCSDSLRTRQTLELMAEAVEAFRNADVKFLGSYYSTAAMDGQTARHLHETVIKYAAPDSELVMCMGHNRGWEEAASDLSGKSVELKTANAALLESRGAHCSWEEAWQAGWRLREIVRPDPTHE